MRAYKIERWDAILPHDSSNSLPMIYINADTDLLNFAQKNNYNFLVEIRGTNSIYDGKQINGIFDSILLGPNRNSQIIKDKNWYTISLNSYFYSYPPKLGEVIILGLPDSSNTIPSVNSPGTNAPVINNLKSDLLQNSYLNKNYLKGMSLTMIIVTLSLIIIMVFIIFFLFNKKK